MTNEIKQRIEMINRGEIPQGYKKTAVGIVPEEWAEKSLGLLSTNKGTYGINAPACNYDDNLPIYLRITDIDDNGNFSSKNKACVNDENSRNYYLKENDIVFARTGATTGKTYLYSTRDGKLVYAGFLIKFSINPKLANSYLVKQFCNTSYYWKWIKTISARSGQPGINAEEYSKYKIIISKDIQEQQRIADILLKWDKLIELQEKLIEKLDIQKKGLMQKLLTPKEGWENVKLGDMAFMQSGGTPKSTIEEYYNGNIIWVSINDISLCGKYLSDSERKITEKGLQNSTARIFPKNSILYAMYASIGKCCITNIECCTSQAILGIITNKNLDSEYLYYYLFNNREKFVLQGQKGTQSNLNKEMVQSFKISKPKNINEQVKISSRLGMVDEYINLQTQKLEKLKQQRKSMQQLLLTGIVRV